jgi:hypothetical protein
MALVSASGEAGTVGSEYVIEDPRSHLVAGTFVQIIDRALLDPHRSAFPGMTAPQRLEAVSELGHLVQYSTPVVASTSLLPAATTAPAGWLVVVFRSRELFQEALAHAKNDGIEYLLSDRNAPDDPYRFDVRIRQEGGDEEAIDVERIDAMRAGLNIARTPVLAKPFTREALGTCIRQVLDQKPSPFRVDSGRQCGVQARRYAAPQNRRHRNRFGRP